MQSMWMARRQCSHSANLKPWPPHTKQHESPVAYRKTNIHVRRDKFGRHKKGRLIFVAKLVVWQVNKK